MMRRLILAASTLLMILVSVSCSGGPFSDAKTADPEATCDALVRGLFGEAGQLDDGRTGFTAEDVEAQAILLADLDNVAPDEISDEAELVSSAAQGTLDGQGPAVGVLVPSTYGARIGLSGPEWEAAYPAIAMFATENCDLERAVFGCSQTGGRFHELATIGPDGTSGVDPTSLVEQPEDALEHSEGVDVVRTDVDTDTVEFDLLDDRGLVTERIVVEHKMSQEGSGNATQGWAVTSTEMCPGS